MQVRMAPPFLFMAYVHVSMAIAFAFKYQPRNTEKKSTGSNVSVAVLRRGKRDAFNFAF